MGIVSHTSTGRMLATRISRAVTPFSVLAVALLLSISFNLLAAWRLRRLTSSEVDDSMYSYKGDDYPNRLPLALDDVALTFEGDSDGRYAVAGPKAWSQWKTLDRFPHTSGFVRLGPNGRGFGVSMFHQLHCLDKIREALVRGYSGHHTHHCFNFMRQAILCASDTTLDPLNLVGRIGTDGVGVTHVCRDWTQVYDFVRANQELWPAGNYSVTGDLD